MWTPDATPFCTCRSNLFFLLQYCRYYKVLRGATVILVQSLLFCMLYSIFDSSHHLLPSKWCVRRPPYVIISPTPQPPISRIRWRRPWLHIQTNTVTTQWIPALHPFFFHIRIPYITSYYTRKWHEWTYSASKLHNHNVRSNAIVLFLLLLFCGRRTRWQRRVW